MSEQAAALTYDYVFHGTLLGKRKGERCRISMHGREVVCIRFADEETAGHVVPRSTVRRATARQLAQSSEAAQSESSRSDVSAAAAPSAASEKIARLRRRAKSSQVREPVKSQQKRRSETRRRKR